jgi:hypothetical protein
MKDDSKKENNEIRGEKKYVKPSVVKHTAASLVVGSCTQYNSNTSTVFCGSYANGTYYH